MTSYFSDQCILLAYRVPLIISVQAHSYISRSPFDHEKEIKMSQLDDFLYDINTFYIGLILL